MFDLIRGIPKRFGYIHESELTEDYLAFKLAEAVGDPMEYTIDKAEEDAIFKDLSNIEHLPKFLTATMARDIQRSFASTDEERPVIRGAFARTSWMRGKIRTINEVTSQTKTAKTKLESLHYG